MSRPCCVMRAPPSLTTLRFDAGRTSADAAVQFVRSHMLADACCSYSVSALSPPLDDVVAIESMPIDADGAPACGTERLTHIYVDWLAGKSIMRGANLFAAGILASSRAFVENEPVAVYMDLSGECSRAACAELPPSRRVFIGRGVTAIGRRALFSNNALVSGVGVRLTGRRFTRGAAPINAIECDAAAAAMGLRAQNVPSALAVHALLPHGHSDAPRRRLRVLDMCAAPGGKTAHLAALCNHRADIVACESNRKRARTLVETLHQLQYDSVSICHIDSTKLIKTGQCCTLNEPSVQVDFGESSFDYVLLDTPCSNLGQRPLTFDTSKAKPSVYVPLQKKLFAQAVALLATNGRLLYSTCSLSVEENEALVHWALAKWPGSLRIVPLDLGAYDPGDGAVRPRDSPLGDCESRCVKRFDPRCKCARHDYYGGEDCVGVPAKDVSLYGDSLFHCTHANGNDMALDTIGFFMACFEKL